MRTPWRVPLMRHAFPRERCTRRALSRFVLEAPRLSMGEQCREFERAFARGQGRRHAVLFNSGASANLALLQALRNLGRLKARERVGFSAVTWATNVMPIIQLGCRPVPIDCNPATLNSMAADVRARLRQTELRALFLTNALGFTGDLPAIRDLARRRGIILLEDNCESLGTMLPEGRSGNFGLASTSSFFVGHHLSTIEGGMAATDDPELVQMLRIVRANGWDRNLTPRQADGWRRRFRVDDFQARYAFYDLGYNLRPTELTGFLGLRQVRQIAECARRRQENYIRVESALSANPDLMPLDRSHIRRLSSFAIPVMCRTPHLRRVYTERFVRAGIESRPLIAGNMERQPFYAKYVRERYPLPGADLIHHCAFYCGNRPDMSRAELNLIVRCLRPQA
ncbi:MAG: DegT/DnrJ/EryC1/StrS family aminotransferase [Elusimicrobia bacterium]|nr:DegT/DnrJ/EryC1/StrS family aminotransferase [Elusimicrobiota bacterium]